jgi:ubiquitin-protein ligase
LDKVLASIQGPPETPYEGGVFWITVKLSGSDPYGPPLMRFHTKVYHPNISPQGHICADYKEKWNSVLSAGFSKAPAKDPSAQWYRGKSTEPKWTLGALLTALCGLLASPDVDDPLVPEIAAKYLEDYEGYCENARLYTKKFATDSRRPDSDILRFLEDSKPNEPASAFPEPDNDIKSLQDSLRRAYDTEAFTTSKTTSWKADFASTANSDSIDTTRDNISSSAGQSLDQALLSIFGWPNGRDLLKSSYLNSNYLVATLEALASKEDLEKFLWQATDQNAEIVHALLLKADSFLKTQSARKMNMRVTPLGPLTTYQNLKTACIDYLRTIFSEANLLVVYDKSSACYEISITCPGWTKYEHIWRTRRTWHEFVQLNESISSHAPAAVLWNQELGWKRFSGMVERAYHRSEPDPNVMGPLLGFRLKRAMLNHGDALLEHSEIISFLRPEGYPDTTNPLPPRPCLIISEATYPPICLQSFIDSTLFNGRIASYYTLTRSTFWEKGKYLNMRLQEPDPLTKRGWRVSWDSKHEQKFIRTKDITDVRMQANGIITIDYNPTQALELLFMLRTLYLEFPIKVDNDLWYETLLIFHRISQFLSDCWPDNVVQD